MKGRVVIVTGACGARRLRARRRGGRQPGVRKSLEDLTADELDLSFAVNTRATLLLVKALAAQHDDSRPGGRVALFTSGVMAAQRRGLTSG